VMFIVALLLVGGVVLVIQGIHKARDAAESIVHVDPVTPDDADAVETPTEAPTPEPATEEVTEEEPTEDEELSEEEKERRKKAREERRKKREEERKRREEEEAAKAAAEEETPTEEEAPTAAAPDPSNPWGVASGDSGSEASKVCHTPVVRAKRGTQIRLKATVTPAGAYTAIIWYRAAPGGAWLSYTSKTGPDGVLSAWIPAGPWQEDTEGPVHYYVEVHCTDGVRTSGSKASPHTLNLY